MVLSSSNSSAFAQQYSNGMPPTYGISELSPSNAINQSVLFSATRGDLSVSALEGFIEQKLLPFDIRLVLLDIGWQNYKVGEVPYEQWVSNWLTACDSLGVGNVLFVPQLTTLGVNSTWVNSLLAIDPSVRTFDALGRPINYFSFDNPDVTTYLENDLSLLLSYYGNHTSWIGLSAGVPYSNPYYQYSSEVPVMGYSNFSIQSFINSVYYFRDVNASGFLQNGLPDPLWSTYVNTSQTIQLSSGVWMESVPYRVSGNGSMGTTVRVRFYLPENVSEVSFSWYGYRVGHPGPLLLQPFSDANGVPGKNLTPVPIEDPAQDVGTTPGWQTSPALNVSLASGWYWLFMSDPIANDSNYYYVYQRAYQVTNAEQVQLLGNSVQNITSPILEVLQNGKPVQVYPYQQDVPNPQPTQNFIATRSFSFNAVFLFLSDRAYNPINATVEVIDQSSGTIVGEGILSQALLRGVQNWSPVFLNTTVNAIQGHTYEISVVEPPQSQDSWATVLRGVFTNPASSGFQNQSSYLLFRLELLGFSGGLLTSDRISSNGRDAVRNGLLDAVRIIPSSNETMESFSILMKNLFSTGENYTGQGTFTVSVRPSSSKGNFPSNITLESMSVPGSKVPQNGWVNITGFHVSLTKGNPYWIVMSSNSSSGFSLARLTSAYKYQVLVSPNNGTSWIYPFEGPTELSFMVNTTRESFGNFIEAIPEIPLSGSQEYAQPFSVSAPTEAVGIYMGIIERANLLPLGSALKVSIHPDNGKNAPSGITLASGLYSGYNLTFYSPDQVQFSTIAMLSPGIKYWIVIQPTNGTYYVDPVEYSVRPLGLPANWTALISPDSGKTWSRISNFTTILSYELISPSVSNPTLSTSQISTLLAEYHGSPVDSQEPHGWNAYIMSSQIKTFEALASEAVINTGRNFHFFIDKGNALTFLANSGAVEAVVSMNLGSCSELVNALLDTFPQSYAQYMSIRGVSIQSCPSFTLSQYIKQLQLMSYIGPQYGARSETSILVIGNSPPQILLEDLEAIANVQFVQIQPGSNSPPLVNLSAYPAVIWTASEPVGKNIQTQFYNYVQSGGRLIFVGYPPDWGLNLIGFNPTEIPSYKLSANLSYTKQLTIFTTHTPYSSGLSLGHPTPNSTLAVGNNILVSTNKFGSGTVVVLESTQNMLALSLASPPIQVLSNILQYISTGSPASIWFNLGSTPESQQQITASLSGIPGGPLEVWISNPTNTTLSVVTGLNASAVGMNGAWKVIDPLSLTSMNGTAETIKYTMMLSNYSWDVIYLEPQRSDFIIQYTNIRLLDQLTYPSQTIYYLEGTYNETALFVVSMHSSIRSVSVDAGESLPQYGITQALFNASHGWYYDSSSATLFVKYNSSELDTVRIFISPTLATPFQEFVTVWGLPVLAALAAVEGLTYLAFKIKNTPKLR